MKTVTILDGYIDEPACLGVPPYLSPYPRYIAGALLDFDSSLQLNYLTIDRLRSDDSAYQLLTQSNLIIVIAGTTVPGKYLSGYPASPQELTRLLQPLRKPLKILAGPAARHGFGMGGGQHTINSTDLIGVFDIAISGDAEIVVTDLLENEFKTEDVDLSKKRTSAHDISEYAKKGADIVLQHPNYPHYLLLEIETYRGCSRSITGGCSFCSEPSKGAPDYRPIQDIIEEVESLYLQGIRHIRLGSQPCMFSYQAHGAGSQEIPRPNPQALHHLFKGIRDAAPDLLTFHIDNVNPAVVARYPKESAKIAQTIITYHSPGDVAAMGVETADPQVVAANNLKASAEESLEAIRLLNEYGAVRGDNGLPELLPGINLLFGLLGESKKTFDLDYQFLKQIIDDELLLRRINIRQVIPIPGTPLESESIKLLRKHKASFKSFKRKVKEEIERPLLRRLVPTDTILKKVYTETYNGNLTYARQLGSYPLLVGIPGRQHLGEFINSIVVDHGYRSITALPYPLDINTAPKESLEALPEVGEKRARRILNTRPFSNSEEFIASLDEQDLAERLLKYLSLIHI